MAKNSDIFTFYDFENIDKYLVDLETFGSIDKSNGDFIFEICSDCRGPLMAHKKCLTAEKTMLWKEDQVALVMTNVKQSYSFQAALGKFDKRMSVTYCDICKLKMNNQSALECHMNIMHKRTMKFILVDEDLSTKTITTHERPPQMLIKTLKYYSQPRCKDYIKEKKANAS